jgi:hypothetical protein
MSGSMAADFFFARRNQPVTAGSTIRMKNVRGELAQVYLADLVHNDSP